MISWPFYIVDIDTSCRKINNTTRTDVLDCCCLNVLVNRHRKMYVRCPQENKETFKLFMFKI